MTAIDRTAVREHVLVDGFPPGTRDLLDVENSASNFYKEFDAVAGVLVDHGFALEDQFRTESLPSNATSGTHGLHPDWERAFHIAPPASAASTIDATRQATVTARFREFGASTTANIFAALAAVCGEHAVTIIEQVRSVRTAINWYELPSYPAIAASADTDLVIAAADNAAASGAGAQVTVRITHPSIEDLTLIFFAPDASQSSAMTFGSGSVTAQDFRFSWPDAAEKTITGDWTIRITDSGAAGGAVIDPAADGVTGLFVEGIGRDLASGAPGKASPIFVWAALVDTSLAISAYSVSVARSLVARWNPAHCRGYLAQYNGASGMYMRCDDALTPCDGGLAG